MSSSRTVVWVSSILYGTVLVAGLYYDLGHLDRPGAVGHGPFPVVGFVSGIASLFAIDLFERRRYPARTPPGPAVALLCVRLLLFIGVAALDGSGLSRILLVLVPFTAYFAFGRVTSAILGAVCVGVVVTGYSVSVPRWYADSEYVSDLLMFCIGVVLSIAMAAVAAGEQDSRARLEESHTRLAAYAAKVAELSAATERVRLARDIHDGLGHHLTAISVLLEKASAFSERDPVAAEQALADARDSARRALDDVRRSVRTLRADQEPFSLSAALRDLVRNAGDGQLAVALDVVGDETGCDMPTRTALFRAAQEALTNARRHARADHVSVRLTFDDSGAELVVADDGRGLTVDDNRPLSVNDGHRLTADADRTLSVNDSYGLTGEDDGELSGNAERQLAGNDDRRLSAGREGFGLIGMRERIQLVGGRVDLDSGPATGTRVTVTVPRRSTA